MKNQYSENNLSSLRSRPYCGSLPSIKGSCAPTFTYSFSLVTLPNEAPQNISKRTVPRTGHRLHVLSAPTNPKNVHFVQPIIISFGLPKSRAGEQNENRFYPTKTHDTYRLPNRTKSLINRYSILTSLMRDKLFH